MADDDDEPLPKELKKTIKQFETTLQQVESTLENFFESSLKEGLKEAERRA